MWRNQLFVLDMSSDVLSADTSIRRDVGCKTVANMIKGKSPEEIRKLFNIVNDFTPEEEVCLHIYPITLQIHLPFRSPTYRLKSKRRTSGPKIDERLKTHSFWLSSCCSVLLRTLLFTTPAVRVLHPRALQTQSHPSRTSTLLLGTPTCLLVILRYSAAAPTKYSITNRETLPWSGGRVLPH